MHMQQKYRKIFNYLNLPVNSEVLVKRKLLLRNCSCSDGTCYFEPPCIMLIVIIDQHVQLILHEQC